MSFDTEKFNELKKNAEELYNKVGSIHCPYFNEKVHFNSKGLDHLLFKQWNKSRPINDQMARLRHLYLAPEIVKLSKTLQGIYRAEKFERIKINKKWQKKLKVTTYYEFIAVMPTNAGANIRVKVIVKQIDGGEKFFLSIIPSWGLDKKTGDRILHTGNPEHD